MLKEGKKGKSASCIASCRVGVKALLYSAPCACATSLPSAIEALVLEKCLPTEVLSFNVDLITSCQVKVEENSGVKCVIIEGEGRES